jgi:hypothetical protein
MNDTRVEVDCSPRPSGVLEPRRLRIGQSVYDVAEILDRWYEGPRRAGGPTRQYIKIRSRGGSQFLLAHDTPADAWVLVKAFGPEIPPVIS